MIRHPDLLVRPVRQRGYGAAAAAIHLSDVVENTVGPRWRTLFWTCVVLLTVVIVLIRGREVQIRCWLVETLEDCPGLHLRYQLVGGKQCTLLSFPQELARLCRVAIAAIIQVSNPKAHLKYSA